MIGTLNDRFASKDIKDVRIPRDGARLMSLVIILQFNVLRIVYAMCCKLL